MLRCRFEASPDDPRPANWPIKHPYWVTGESSNGCNVVVAYADDLDYIVENWPETEEYVDDIQIEEREDYVFTDRFPKPEWFNPPVTAPSHN